MPETLDNPVLKDEEIDRAFMAAAAQADRGEDITMPSTIKDGERAPVETEKKEKQETSSTDTLPETTGTTTTERPRDEHGRFTKREDGSDIPEGERVEATDSDKSGSKEDDSKPESAYTRAQKDKERLDRNRREFEEEKAREREQFAQERQRIAEERRQIDEARKPQQTQEGKSKVTSAQYAEFAQEAAAKARKARAQGDYDTADEQADLATKATTAALDAHEREQAESYQQAATQSQSAWESEMAERIRQEPDLQKSDTPLAKETMAVMGEYPVFERIPPIRLPSGKIMGGFSFAAEVAKLRLNAGRVSVLEKENQEKTAEIKRLNGLLGLDGGGPITPLPQKTFEDMTDAQQDAYLKRQAARIDAGH